MRALPSLCLILALLGRPAAGGATILFGGPSAEKTEPALVTATPTDVSLQHLERF